MSSGGENGRDRLYWRDGRGWYCDLRDLGGRQRACIPEDERTATEDRDEAVKILGRYMDELEEEDPDDPRLEEYAKRHLRLKRDVDDRAESTIERDDRHLRNVLAYFGRDVRLSEIDVEGLTDFMAHRLEQEGRGEGTTVSNSEVRGNVHALSSLYKRAVREGKAEENPARKVGKPSPAPPDSVWLEPGEAAALLDAAATYDEDPPNRATHPILPIFATWLYTGMRKMEGLGLLRRDVDLERGVVHVAGNEHRRIKGEKSGGVRRRTIPIWPHLDEILWEYLAEHHRPEDGLLFVGRDGGLITDLQKCMDTCVEAAGIDEGKRVTQKVLRHTYASQRIQTLDHGRPVSLFTVARELGHQGVGRIEEVYGHLQNTRHRSEVVEYRAGEVAGAIEEGGERAG